LINPALLALADGSLFYGRSIGIPGRTVGEVVFNTAMSGYQEILSDPSYCRQIVTLTYPHIGNTGANSGDQESARVFASGLVIRDLPLTWSNWRAQMSLPEYLEANAVVAIADIDTRRLTRLLRERGAQNGCIVAGDDIDADAAIAEARKFAGLKGMDLAREVTTEAAYEWLEGSWDLDTDAARQPVQAAATRHVVAYDFGVKHNILRLLVDQGCRVTVVPATTPAQVVMDMEPDGVFLSNGPGDPEPCDYAIDAIRTITSAGLPVFGICLGHQLLALASGAGTVKMKFGHHGANHPVQCLQTSAVMITSQNHGFAVDEQGLPANLVATHRSLFDGSLQGVQRTDVPAFGFQGHPEASPGPHDVQGLFSQFMQMMDA